jgi:hypothetical protein
MRRSVEWATGWEPEHFDILVASRRIKELMG